MLSQDQICNSKTVNYVNNPYAGSRRHFLSTLPVRPYCEQGVYLGISSQLINDLWDFLSPFLDIKLPQTGSSFKK